MTQPIRIETETVLPDAGFTPRGARAFVIAEFVAVAALAMSTLAVATVLSLGAGT